MIIPTTLCTGLASVPVITNCPLATSSKLSRDLALVIEACNRDQHRPSTISRRLIKLTTLAGMLIFSTFAYSINLITKYRFGEYGDEKKLKSGTTKSTDRIMTDVGPCKLFLKNIITILPVFLQLTICPPAMRDPVKPDALTASLDILTPSCTQITSNITSKNWPRHVFKITNKLSISRKRPKLSTLTRWSWPLLLVLHTEISRFLREKLSLLRWTKRRFQSLNRVLTWLITLTGIMEIATFSMRNTHSSLTINCHSRVHPITSKTLPRNKWRN